MNLKENMIELDVVALEEDHIQIKFRNTRLKLISMSLSEKL